MARWLGSWVCRSRDRGETWNRPVWVPVHTPHGPIRLLSEGLLYFGKEFGDSQQVVTEGNGPDGDYFAALGHGGQLIAFLDQFNMVIVDTADPHFLEHNGQAWRARKQSRTSMRISSLRYRMSR